MADAPARELSQRAYIADFYHEFERGGDICYKLERQQIFREPGDPSWAAFIAGDWTTVLALLEREDRELAATIAARDRETGIETRRLRVVEFPISPYLQWEMQFFRLLAEEGQDLRVLRAEQVARLETQLALPEVVTIGDRVLYEVVYDTDGTPDGGRRIDDPEIVAGCREELAHLYAQGQPLLDFYKKHIAPLPPPAV